MTAAGSNSEQAPTRREGSRGAEAPVAPGGDPAHRSDAAPAAAPVSTLRIRHGELVSAVSAVALLGLTFLTKWYGVAGVPDPSAARPAITTAENGWDALTVVRWVMLVTICAALGTVLLHASQRSHGTKTDTSRVVAGLGTLTSVLLIYRVLIALPAANQVIDQKLGAILGLLCALGIALGGWESVRAQRMRPAKTSRRARRGLASGRRAR